jgi:uncharacterized tellurite resistance protein B-like protein
VIGKLAAMLEAAFGGEAAQEDTREHAVRVATALLLVEVARADYEDDPLEEATIRTTLKEFFALRDEEAEMLIEESRLTADRTAGLQQFTRLLHEQLTAEEKQTIVEMLWRVALADERLDKHEDHLVRKIAGLLYVPHRDLIRLRNKVRGTE